MAYDPEEPLVCDHCEEAKPDVEERPDWYARDVYNRYGATHSSCQTCHDERRNDV